MSLAISEPNSSIGPKARCQPGRKTHLLWAVAALACCCSVVVIPTCDRTLGSLLAALAATLRPVGA